MKKIMFNDKFCLTQAVLDGRKTMTRRICKYDRPSEEWEIGFPVFESNDFNDEGECASPLNYAFGWRNEKTGEEIKWNIPRYKVGEVVSIAQNYNSVIGFNPTHSLFSEKGYKNKMFVKADLMPHHIKIAGIKIQKLQDISDEDCLREGIKEDFKGVQYSFDSNIGFCGQYPYNTPREAFAALIGKVSGKVTWESNPYVFVYEFELIK